MTVTTLTSREFNQDTGRAKKAAAAGPVVITDRGRPSHVLLCIEERPRGRQGRERAASGSAGIAHPRRDGVDGA